MTEDFIKDTFRSREHLVEGAQAGLANAARSRAVRRRRASWVAAGSLTLTVLLGATLAAVAVGRPDGVAGPPVVPAAPTTQPPPGAASDGWRLESSRGAQIEVPTNWATNDYGCNQTDKPSVVRGQGAVRDCFTPEPSTKELAILGSGPMPDFYPGVLLAVDQITVDGVPAVRRPAYRYDDGRYLGWVTVESRDVHLIVRTLDEATATHILGSFRLVDPDHLGCPAVLPDMAPQGTTAPGRPDAISVCDYISADHRLEASAEVTGDRATALAAQLAAAPAGRNPDLPPDLCGDRAPAKADVVLLLRSGGSLHRIWVTFTRCTGRGLTDGVDEWQLSDALIHEIMRPLQVGYGFPSTQTK